MIAAQTRKRVAAATLAITAIALQGCARPETSPSPEQPLAVAIDAWLVDVQMVEPLRQAIVGKLRQNGFAVTDTAPANAAINAPVERPTLVVWIGLHPDGSDYVTNLYMKVPSDPETEGPTFTWASHPYLYASYRADHSPILDYIDDFLDANPIVR